MVFWALTMTRLHHLLRPKALLSKAKGALCLRLLHWVHHVWKSEVARLGDMSQGRLLHSALPRNSMEASLTLPLGGYKDEHSQQGWFPQDLLSLKSLKEQGDLTDQAP